MERRRQFMVRYNHLASIPTWAITNAFSPLLPKTHPWKNKWFTLRDWHQHETPTCRAFNTVGWVIAGQFVGFLIGRLILEFVK